MSSPLNNSRSHNTHKIQNSNQQTIDGIQNSAQITKGLDSLSTHSINDMSTN